MAMSREELEAVFYSAVPMRAMRALVRMVEESYATASRTRKETYQGPEGYDLIGHIRRALIECGVRGVADVFDGMEASTELNVARNSRHVQIRAGRIRLTASATESRSAAPREAIFRADYAQSNQLDLFRGNDPDPMSRLFAILAHGADATDESKPGWVMIGFPDPNPHARTFMHTIDLMAKCTPVPTSGEPTPEPTLLDISETEES